MYTPRNDPANDSAEATDTVATRLTPRRVAGGVPVRSGLRAGDDDKMVVKIEIEHSRKKGGSGKGEL